MLRKLLPVLGAAVVAVALASSCAGKHTKCADAGSKKEECVADKFEKDKFNCVFNDSSADATKHVCEEKTAAVLESMAKAVCFKLKADQATCEKADQVKVEGYKGECKFDAAATDDDKKCLPEKKNP